MDRFAKLSRKEMKTWIKNKKECSSNHFLSSAFKSAFYMNCSRQKKRDMALQRLDHRYLSMLKNDYLIEIKPPNSWPEDTYDLLKQYGAPDMCYCLSENELISGKTLPLREALEHAIGFGFASIISCIPGELAYFEAEQSFGPPPRYLLKKPSNR